MAGAVAMGETGEIQARLAQLEQMDADLTKRFQAWWVAKAYLLSLQGKESFALADQAYQIAIGLSNQEKIKIYLEGIRKKLK